MELPDNTRFPSVSPFPTQVFHQSGAQTPKVISLHFIPAPATSHDGIVCSQFFLFFMFSRPDNNMEKCAW